MFGVTYVNGNHWAKLRTLPKRMMAYHAPRTEPEIKTSCFPQCPLQSREYDSLDQPFHFSRLRCHDGIRTAQAGGRVIFHQDMYNFGRVLIPLVVYQDTSDEDIHRNPFSVRTLPLSPR